MTLVGDKYLLPDKSRDRDTEAMHDFLHLTPKGYDIWAEAIKGEVKEILGEAKGQ